MFIIDTLTKRASLLNWLYFMFFYSLIVGWFFFLLMFVSGCWWLCDFLDKHYSSSWDRVPYFSSGWGICKFLVVRVYSSSYLLLTITLYRHPIQTYQILLLRFVSEIPRTHASLMQIVLVLISDRHTAIHLDNYFALTNER